MINAKKKILTVGSGPTYTKWKYWPTWSKMLPLYFNCVHKDVSAPAAGNLFITRTIIDNISTFKPDILIVQWNQDKFDLYLEKQRFIDEIINSKSIRNFIIDPDTQKTITQGPGYWCSSKDNVVEWKKYYNEEIKTYIGTMMNDLQNMLLIQTICQLKNIKYGFFNHNYLDHEKLSVHPRTKHLHKLIDWSLQIYKLSLEQFVDSHPSKTLNVSPERESTIPCPNIMFSVLEKIIEPFMEKNGVFVKNQNKEKLKKYCKKKSIDVFEEYKK